MLQLPYMINLSSNFRKNLAAEIKREPNAERNRKSENLIMDAQGTLWKEREAKLIEKCNHIIALRGAGSVNGISVSDAEKMLNEHLFPRIKTMLEGGKKVAFIFDGDNDDRTYPDIGYIIGRIRDEFDKEECTFLAVQKDDWWDGDGGPIHNANGKEYETYIIDAKNPPENIGGLAYSGQQGTEHNALSQSATLVNSGKYSQWYVGAVGPIARQQIKDLELKSEKGIPISIFKTSVSVEQAVSLQKEIDTTQQWLTETKAMGENVPEDRKSQISRAKERLARLLSSRERRGANPFGLFFDKDGNDNGSFADLIKTHVEVISV